MIFPLSDILDTFNPISLQELADVSLMDRFDTKYLMSAHRLPEFIRRLDGAYRVLEIDGCRIFPYSTTYLDTSDFTFYKQHITGRPGRSKVRFRTYVNTGNTFLEVKKKTVKNRTLKWRIDNSLTMSDSCDNVALEFINSHLSAGNMALFPVLRNEFQRITLAGRNNDERMTIDLGISFYNNKAESCSLTGLTIIELKRESSSARSRGAYVLKSLAVHPTGFSKYCVGLSKICDVPKKSILKEKILSINKIENEFNSSFIVSEG